MFSSLLLVLFHSFFYFIYINNFHFIFIYSDSPEFCVHFTKEMRPNGEELPKLSLCDVGRHKLMQCDIVTLVKGGRSCGNSFVIYYVSTFKLPTAPSSFNI